MLTSSARASVKTSRNQGTQPVLSFPYCADPKIERRMERVVFMQRCDGVPRTQMKQVRQTNLDRPSGDGWEKPVHVTNRNSFLYRGFIRCWITNFFAGSEKMKCHALILFLLQLPRAAAQPRIGALVSIFVRTRYRLFVSKKTHSLDLSLLVAPLAGTHTFHRVARANFLTGPETRTVSTA